MGCSEYQHRITVEVPGANLEIAPHSVDFRRERQKFDWFRGTFHEDVGNHIKPMVVDSSGVLSIPQKAWVKMEGKRVYPMLWRGDGVEFGKDETYIKLFDPLHDLENAVADIQTNSEHASNIAQTIFDQYVSGTNSRILDEIKFVPDEKNNEDKYITEVGFQPNSSIQDNSVAGTRGSINTAKRAASNVASAFTNVASNAWNNVHEVEYDEISCLSALLDLAKRVEYDVWTEPESPASDSITLCVGAFETRSRGKGHLATVEGPPHYKISNFAIPTGRKPIETIIARGKPVHDDWFGRWENIKEAWSAEDGGGRLNAHDYIAHAVIRRKMAGDGRTVVFDVNAPVDALKPIAKTNAVNILARDTDGEIEVRPSQSSKEEADYRNIAVGDVIGTAEPGDPKCAEKSQIYENEFYIEGVEHNISNGSWTINLDVVDSIEKEDIPDAKIRFFDPVDGSYTDPSDLDSFTTYGKTK